MNNKGSVIPVALVAVLVIAMVILTMQNSSILTPSADVNSSQKIISEVNSSIDSALRNSTQEFMGFGFSDENRRSWFVNGLYMPFPDEIHSTYNSLSKREVNFVLDRLKEKRDYNFNSYDLNVFVNLPDYNKQERIEVFLEKLVQLDSVELDYNVYAGIGKVGEDLKGKEYLFSSDKTLPYSSWIMYSKMALWSIDYLAKLNSEVSVLLDSVSPCQSNVCSCSRLTGLPNPSATQWKSILSNDLNELKKDFNTLFEHKLNMLNAYFANTPITCTITSNNIFADVDINIMQYCVEDFDESRMLRCGSGEIRTGNPLNYFKKEPFEWINDQSKTRDVYVSSDTTFFDPYKVVLGNELVDCEDNAYGRDERTVINPLIQAELVVKCVDPTKMVSISRGADNLSAEFLIRVGIQKNCNFSSLHFDNLNDSGCELVDGGGAGGGGCPSVNDGRCVLKDPSCKCDIKNGIYCLGSVTGCPPGQEKIIGYTSEGCPKYGCNVPLETTDANCCAGTNIGNGGGTDGGAGEGEDGDDEGDEEGETTCNTTLGTINDGDTIGCAKCTCTGSGCSLLYQCPAPTDKCMRAQCAFVAADGNYKCNETPKTDCGLSDNCVERSCDSTTGSCRVVSKVDCSDSDNCTIDSCVPSDGSCKHDPKCIATDPCHLTKCNPSNGSCINNPICVDEDNNGCTEVQCRDFGGTPECYYKNVTACDIMSNSAAACGKQSCQDNGGTSYTCVNNNQNCNLLITDKCTVASCLKGSCVLGPKCDIFYYNCNPITGTCESSGGSG